MVEAAKEKSKISTIQHPTFTNMQTEWTKFRAAFEGGMTFVTDYLSKYSAREDDTDFDLRKKISYCPAHAKAAILDVKNSIYQRLVSVTRVDGPISYQEAITGKNLGVDLQGRSMDDFIGSIILQELIVMGKVGVYVDKPLQAEGATLLDANLKRPYLYHYKAEEIRAWAYDEQLQLVSLLLQDSRDVMDKETGLVKETEIIYRHLRKTDAGVEVKFYNTKDEEITEMAAVLSLPRIPFVLFEISSSLMVDVADYQVALLNLASSDMKYSVSANFPFYVEQYDQGFSMNMLKHATPIEDKGGTKEAKKSKEKEIKVGVSQGRSYPKGTDQPAFIHPSAEPLLASMKKQDALIKEIRQIINLSITNLEPQRESAESKQHDDQGLEAGLSYIGMELSYGEREIAEIWAMYEGSKSGATIKYPDEYKLISDEKRMEMADKYEEMMGKIPSPIYKKVVAKKIVKLSLGNTATPEMLETINKEIDEVAAIISDPDTIRSDHEAGLVGDELASRLRGYPEDEYKTAQADHAKRATRILEAQTSNAGARGVDDLSNDTEAGRKEKAAENNPDKKPDASDSSRGKG